MKETKACLMLHGFTGGPYEVEPLGDHLRERGWVCSIPRLPGHDEHLLELRDVSWNDWIGFAEAQARHLADKHGSFDLVGFSMGGMLAVHLAARFPIRRLVLLNAAAIYISPRRLAIELARRFKENAWDENDLKLRQTPLRATIQFMQLVKHAKPSLASVAAPTLIAQGLMDPIVHPSSAQYLAGRIGLSAEVRYLPNSRHMICLDTEAEELFQTVERFLSV